jgi:hypothetical protein
LQAGISILQRALRKNVFGAAKVEFCLPLQEWPVFSLKNAICAFYPLDHRPAGHAKQTGAVSAGKSKGCIFPLLVLR